MRRFYTAICAAILSVGTAYAVPVTPQEVHDVLATNGATDLSITPTEGSTSSRVSGKIDGINFTADVRICENDRNGCKAVLFFANYSLGRDAIPSDYVSMNDYNDHRTWGRAYVLTDEIGIDYTVDLYDENEFGKNEVETWQVILNAFNEHNNDDSKAK